MSRKYKFQDSSELYFVSFAVIHWIDVFTRNVYKDIVVDSLKYCIENKGLDLHAWVIMPNHLHLIISSESAQLVDVLRDFKRHTATYVLDAIRQNLQESRRDWMLALMNAAGARNGNNSGAQFWQQHNHPVQLFSDNMARQKLEYLHENPVRAGFVEEVSHWVYSSAGAYEGVSGLIDVFLLDV